MTRRTTPDPRLIRASIALVWLYEGLWCKLLGGMPRHQELVAAVPMIGPGAARSVLLVLGLIECCMAGWVLSGKQLHSAALVQTVLLVAMNAGGLIWAWRLIPDPGSMIVQNFAFVILIWVAAGERAYVTLT